MNERDFCYWLQGFFELDGGDDQARQGLTKEQVEMIKEHLALVFKKVTTPKTEKTKSRGSAS